MTTTTNEPNPDEFKVYAKITFAYSAVFVLPYADGIYIMNYFKNAEQMEESYGKDSKIHGMKDGPKLEIMSHEQYCEIKMRSILQPDEDKE